MEDFSKDVSLKHRSKGRARFSQGEIVGRDVQAEGRAYTKTLSERKAWMGQRTKRAREEM